MKIQNRIFLAALNAALSVVMTALLIGNTSRGAGADNFWSYLLLIAAVLFTTFAAVNLILSLLTDNSARQEMKEAERQNNQNF